jgi:branched-chain amino acid transport system ATP-binding protein
MTSSAAPASARSGSDSAIGWLPIENEVSRFCAFGRAGDRFDADTDRTFSAILPEPGPKRDFTAGKRIAPRNHKRVTGGAPIVETEGLSKSFGGYRAVDDVSLSIAQGSIHAIIGPNGAGKTTLFNLLSGFVTPTSGVVRLGGRDVTGFAPYRIARLGMVRSFQINSIFLHLSVLENVKVSLEAKTELPGRFWLPGSATRRLDGRALELLESVGLARAKDLLAVQLSYGHKRALEIAISLAQDPAILLLDEPTAGMGLEDVGRVTKLIARVREGRTIVLVEHNLRVVADLSDRITVLQRGKVLVEGAYDDVRRDPRVIDAYLGGGAGATA